MLEHETSWDGSTFTVPGWNSIMKRFNEISSRTYKKVQLQHRWKNLKKDYVSYLYLRNKSGWGCDSIYNKPVPPTEDAWFELADRYRKYRHKPFLYFGDMERFFVEGHRNRSACNLLPTVQGQATYGAIDFTSTSEPEGAQF